MEPGNSAAEKIDALAPLWAGLDIAETPRPAQPREACVIERFYTCGAAAGPARPAELPAPESLGFAL
ncbi:MAG TPA: hypothetical protein DEQ38_13485 [Elusimicrobia bacterium]|nr:MAG: hypothetical protein A2089_00100 [Elusimicrobia bacterium GWD2_63_28]HCC49109.1 hypothetical protein [Elusimicrobiota bacterium]